MRNLIQWEGATYWNRPWNPMQGCRPLSPACEHCYAKSFADRYGQSFAPHATKRKNPPKKGIVFCGNATDLFGEWRTEDEMVSDLRKTCAKPATYLWLTKRPYKMASALKALDYQERKTSNIWFPETWYANNYFGFTAENQDWYDSRRNAVYHEFPYWANLWLSLEPLLGPIDDMKIGNVVAGNRLRWVVVGCESGPHRRPCRLEWVNRIVGQCMSAGVPVFVKQLDIDGVCERDIKKFPKMLQVRQVPWKT